MGAAFAYLYHAGANMKNDCAYAQDCPAGLETEGDGTMAEDVNTTVETTQMENRPAATE